jgi:hypothetical protein
VCLRLSPGGNATELIFEYVQPLMRGQFVTDPASLSKVMSVLVRRPDGGAPALPADHVVDFLRGNLRRDDASDGDVDGDIDGGGGGGGDVGGTSAATVALAHMSRCDGDVSALSVHSWRDADRALRHEWEFPVHATLFLESLVFEQRDAVPYHHDDLCALYLRRVQDLLESAAVRCRCSACGNRRSRFRCGAFSSILVQPVCRCDDHGSNPCVCVFDVGSCRGIPWHVVPCCAIRR